MKTFRSNGKLLLTGEYAVLDGALALAVPTKYGQSLSVTPNSTKQIHWVSRDENDNVWFEFKFDQSILGKTSVYDSKDNQDNNLEWRLIEILKSAKILNPNFLSSQTGYDILTRLDFNRNWGLGSSSTLINNIANWANIDPFKLLEVTFGGSGYDIACAKNNTPIFYKKLKDGQEIEALKFHPKFADHLYFVYLNQKQNSREGINNYNKLNRINPALINEISNLTTELVRTQNLKEFDALINEHERIISYLVNMKPIKEQLFSDFNGEIKSLGAWGGDFILVSSISDPRTYFNNKEYNIVIPYNEMVL